MNDTATAPDVKEFDLFDLCELGRWLKLPFAAMRDVGPAVQTLGGLLVLTDKQTFCPVETIAKRACVPVKTARKHLTALDTSGWIENQGRKPTARGRPRRTCTIAITKPTKEAMDDYGVLPWIFTSNLDPKRGPLKWSSLAVLSVVMSRVMTLKKAVDEQDGNGLDSSDYWGSIENMGGEDRFAFSLKNLGAMTGLSRHSIITAKLDLHQRKIICLAGGEGDDGGTNIDTLSPNERYRITQRPAERPGWVYTSWSEVAA